MTITNQIRKRFDEAPTRIKKFEKLRRHLMVAYACAVWMMLGLSVATGKYNHLFDLIVFVSLAVGGLVIYVTSHIQGIDDERRTDAVYLYTEELREYSVENIEALFTAINEIAVVADRSALPEPPKEHISTAEIDKPLSTRERNTLLTIIAALAKEAKIDIFKAPGKSALFIAGLTDGLGTSVSKRAIEDHLKKIPDALETRLK